MNFFVKLRDIPAGSVSSKRQITITEEGYPVLWDILKKVFAINEEDVWGVTINLEISMDAIIPLDPQDAKCSNS